MKIPNSIHTLSKTIFGQIFQHDKSSSAKKKIPTQNSNTEPGKPLSKRKVKSLGINPPSFKSSAPEKKEISIALWSHWSGKNREDVQKSCNPIEKVNGSALLAIKTLLDEKNQVHACQTPGILCLTQQDVFSDFPNRLSGLLEKALSEDKALRKQIYQSDGLLKTPILITRTSDEKAPMRSESVEKVSSSVSFYPYVDTDQRSDTSMLTLYVNDQNIREQDLIKGLKEGLRKATQKADDNLPQLPDISSASEWSHLSDYYGVSNEERLLAKFKKSSVDELPDLSKTSSWSELPDQYLKSRELIQKYLR